MNSNQPEGVIGKEDYAEPQCLLKMNRGSEAPLRSVPMGRIIEKLDEILGRDDWDGAERHLNYWLEDALAGGDKKGALALQGERMGLFRKRGRQAQAEEAIRSALALIRETGMEDSLTGATTYVNIATVYKTFDRAPEALPYFEKARRIYEEHFDGPDARLGGLYNNMGLVLTDLGRFDEARHLYEKALAIMGQIPLGQLEQAVTYLNLADLEEAEKGPEAAEEAIRDLLDMGRAMLDTPSLPRDGYYAYVLRTCAPTFRYYGRFADGDELEALSRSIYQGNEEA